jgi:hypothetical protein
MIRLSQFIRLGHLLREACGDSECGAEKTASLGSCPTLARLQALGHGCGSPVRGRQDPRIRSLRGPGGLAGRAHNSVQAIMRRTNLQQSQTLIPRFLLARRHSSTITPAATVAGNASLFTQLALRFRCLRDRPIAIRNLNCLRLCNAKVFARWQRSNLGRGGYHVKRGTVGTNVYTPFGRAQDVARAHGKITVTALVASRIWFWQPIPGD